MLRQAYRAGSFYEADPAGCRAEAARLLDSAEPPEDLPAEVYGGVVPHAGWMFSGAPAARTIRALASRGRLRRVVIFGADHWGLAQGAAVYDRGGWLTPLGEVPVDEELASALLSSSRLLRADADAHAREHSIEVQLPLMRAACEDVRIVPINISPSPHAVEVGREVGAMLAERFPDAAVVGSTDLTHYGPQYGFTPGGVGAAGLEWARRNDQRILRLIEQLQDEQVISEAAAHQNACGAGAVAATIAACRQMGATRGVCLSYTTSADVLEQVYRTRSDDAVGYAAVVFV